MNEVPRRATRFVFLASGTGRRPSDGSAMWRLMSANNRPMGSSVRAFTDVVSCRAAAHSLHSRSESLQVSVQFDHTTSMWTWRVAQNGVPVAACVHSYLRRFECLRAAQQFVTGIAEASPDDGVVRHLGVRPLPAVNLS